MKVEDINIADYDYLLPEARIAKHPLAERENCLLLVRERSGQLTTKRFRELPSLLDSDTLLIYNNTRVINARIIFHKPTDSKGEGGAQIEIFCLEPHHPVDYAINFASKGSCEWVCLVGNSKKWKNGKLLRQINVEGCNLLITAERLATRDAKSIIRFSWEPSDMTFSDIISIAGVIPIPPYLNRDTEESDTHDYQTIFSRIEGSVAAPTAGLHFTAGLLDEIQQKGIDIEQLTLHVGAGTFQPVKSQTIGAHEMHNEFFVASRNLIEKLQTGGRKVVAVGTTSVRTLESLYHLGCMFTTGNFSMEVPQWYPYADNHPHLSVEESMNSLIKYLNRTDSAEIVASTRLMIAPGYKPKIVSSVVTNFHQPHSTLLLLVSAFTEGQWRQMYDYALKNDYRFLSYGDACLIM